MSYLGYPRLNFAGTFQSDSSTSNNVTSYFDNDTHEPRLQWLQTDYEFFGGWNPRGTGSYRLTDLRITGVCFPDGRTVTSKSDDPIAEGRIADDNLRSNGRIVDLDKANEYVPEIHGLRMRLIDSAGNETLRADLVPSPMFDLWKRAPLPPPRRADSAAAYQSVLTNLVWSATITSPALRALRAATQDDLLSIKWNLDGVEDGDRTGVKFPGTVTFGRMVGSIGPYYSGEPWRVLSARRLRKADENSPLNDAPCRVDERSGLVFVDLGNSIPAVKRGGPLVDIGLLRLAVIAAGGTPNVLAPLDGIDKTFYERLAGIATAKLTPDQLKTVAGSRLVVVNGEAKPALWLSENEDATTLQADESVFRLYPRAPHNTASATLVATKFGRPAANVELYLDEATKPPYEEALAAVDKPPLTTPSRVTTDANGRAKVAISAADPKHPRPWIDGIALVSQYGFASRPNEPAGMLNYRVFDDYPMPARPTWFREVQPIFQQYANLFPAMLDVFDLANYNQVVRHGLYIKKTLLAPLDSPNHMPTTRDLSPGKRDMIVKWLEMNPPPVLEIDTVEDLRAALHQAMLVEQAVIPPYLAALFSIKPGQNVRISEIIRGVVMEEMQHMAQVCNIINAVGGKPQIGRPGLVPTYPGKLPGPVLPDLQVRLRKLSIEHVRDVFMAIEQPEHPTVDGEPYTGAVIDKKAASVDKTGTITAMDGDALKKLEDWFNKAEHKPMTIGWFYTRIARAISRLNAKGKLFTGEPKLQVSWPGAPEALYRVTDLRSALMGIYQIIEQGEGSPNDLDGDNIADPDELGHYYRFEEIVRGRALVKNQQGKWVFEGEPIRFDPEGVHPMVDDPDSFRLPLDSVERRESQLFDAMYTNVLTTLSRVFNGHPEELDNVAGQMYQAETQAKKLLAIPFAPGAPTVLGAAFQSPPSDNP